MESFVLFYMAKRFNKEASCLVTIVDSKFENIEVTSSDRERSLDNMIILALEAIIK
jgi:purine-nucleoside phosphorylase